MNTTENGDSAQALRLAQLEIKMLREQLRQAIAAKDAPANRAQAPAPAPCAAPASAAPMPKPSRPNESNIAKAIAVAQAVATEQERRVLCVEDNAANFELIATILAGRPGTDLAWADCGQKGVDMAAEKTPQLILLDLDLPDMHGSEVLAKLRAADATARTPVIVISADATPSQIERMLAAGAQDYLTKPFDIRRFLVLFDEAFSAR